MHSETGPGAGGAETRRALSVEADSARITPIRPAAQASISGGRLVVVDIDPRHGGDNTILGLERRFGELPETWHFLTGGGGAHILFRHPGGSIKNGAGSLGDGLDVRADGGFIVAPPSRHISGRRHAVSVDHDPDEVPLADLPSWLASMRNHGTTEAGNRQPCQRPGASSSPRASLRGGATMPLCGSPGYCCGQVRKIRSSFST
jgi:hypothetical protein